MWRTPHVCVTVTHPRRPPSRPHLIARLAPRADGGRLLADVVPGGVEVTLAGRDVVLDAGGERGAVVRTGPGAVVRTGPGRAGGQCATTQPSRVRAAAACSSGVIHRP